MGWYILHCKFEWLHAMSSISRMSTTSAEECRKSQSFFPVELDTVWTCIAETRIRVRDSYQSVSREVKVDVEGGRGGENLKLHVHVRTPWCVHMFACDPMIQRHFWRGHGLSQRRQLNDDCSDPIGRPHSPRTTFLSCSSAYRLLFSIIIRCGCSSECSAP
jgi:hypothetical protein